MKRSKTWILFIPAMIVCGIIAFALSQWFTVPSKLPYSVESPKNTGVKALYLLLQKRNNQVGIWNQDYTNLPKSTNDTLMMIHPQEKPPNQEQMQHLLNWVEKGNQIVLWDAPKNSWAKSFQFNTSSCKSLISFRETIPKIDNPWLKEIKSMKWSNDCITPSKEIKPIIVSQHDEILVASRSVGKGSIVFIPDSEMLANKKIDHDDHILLPLAFVDGGEGKVWFDETIHSWPPKLVASPEKKQPLSLDVSSKDETDPTIFNLLQQDVWLIFIELLILLVLLLYAKGKRFAAPRFEEVKEQRNALEYIETLTKWYQRMNLRNEILYGQFERLQSQILLSFYLPEDVSPQLLHQQLEQGLGAEFCQRYKEMTLFITQLKKSKQKIAQNSFMEWSLKIDSLRRELEQWKATPPTSIESKQLLNK
ncbi:DUF4350 domain-containing protein [Hazenella coriacea]|uniref:Uncharacterized protein DUF4350 n=1 Tax=Hazenella coriacea TaxID=1179467 RepID=A0A4R3L2K2_9BACL|nr:DUF4350 domain-containing protein [Hazenella coriacea]TCS93871.1 uncharacterized protein DUF4350 [Hazenella coriacea]